MCWLVDKWFITAICVMLFGPTFWKNCGNSLSKRLPFSFKMLNLWFGKKSNVIFIFLEQIKNALSKLHIVYWINSFGSGDPKGNQSHFWDWIDPQLSARLGLCQNENFSGTFCYKFRINLSICNHNLSSSMKVTKKGRTKSHYLINGDSLFINVLILYLGLICQTVMAAGWTVILIHEK